MRNTILLTGLLAAALAAAGCSHDDSGPIQTDITGAWSFDIASQDGFVSFKKTSLVISESTNGATILTAWMSPDPNGVATVDTNTYTVTMDINNPPAVLTLSGTLLDSDNMRGTGTIGGYGGLRVAAWEAKRL